MTNQPKQPKRPSQPKRQGQSSQQGSQSLRLNKFLAERLGLSRREADEAIAAGQVTIDGQPAILGSRIDKNTKVCYNGKIVPFQAEFLYLAFHKPVGYVCSRRAQGSAPTIYDLLPAKYHHLKTVGRLDKDSSGLILLTNDGDFAYQMTHPKFHKEKIYEVQLDRPLEPLHQQMISDYGIMLDDGPSRFRIVKGVSNSLSETICDNGSKLSEEPSNDGRDEACRGESYCDASERTYTVVLSEGRNRQIRRTFAALGYRVVKLHRTQFGKFILSGLACGKYDIIKL